MWRGGEHVHKSLSRAITSTHCCRMDDGVRLFFPPSGFYSACNKKNMNLSAGGWYERSVISWNSCQRCNRYEASWYQMCFSIIFLEVILSNTGSNCDPTPSAARLMSSLVVVMDRCTVNVLIHQINDAFHLNQLTEQQNRAVLNIWNKLWHLLPLILCSFCKFMAKYILGLFQKQKKKSNKNYPWRILQTNLSEECTSFQTYTPWLRKQCREQSRKWNDKPEKDICVSYFHHNVGWRCFCQDAVCIATHV